MARTNDPSRGQENGSFNGDNDIPTQFVEGDHEESDAESSNDEDTGYELLPQNEPGDPEHNHEEIEEEELSLSQILQQIPPSPQVEAMIQESHVSREREVIHEREALFNDPSSARDTIDMSKDRADQIRQAMSSFQLPQSAIPPWASNMKDEDLHKVLSDKLQTVFQTKK